MSIVPEKPVKPPRQSRRVVGRASAAVSQNYLTYSHSGIL